MVRFSRNSNESGTMLPLKTAARASLSIPITATSVLTKRTSLSSTTLKLSDRVDLKKDLVAEGLNFFSNRASGSRAVV